MKYIASLVLLAGFAGIAVFGFALMEYSMHQGNCIASAITGSPCPSSMLAFISHHIAAVHAVSAIPAQISTITGSFLVLVLVLTLLLFIKVRLAAAPNPFPQSLRGWGRRFQLSDIKLRRWLALYEHSPDYH